MLAVPCVCDPRGFLYRVLTMTIGRRPSSKRPYDENPSTGNELSSSDGEDDQQKQRGSPVTPVDEQSVVSTLPEAAVDASPQPAVDSNQATPDFQLRSIIDTAPLAVDFAGSESSTAPTQAAVTYTPAAVVTTRTYAARFAYPSVCACAEHRTARDAVQRLVSAVRDTAAVLTFLHAEEPVENQCVLLGRMLDFDGFLW